MFDRTRVKICGITNLEDAELAINAGADAIGLVFYEPSPRCVDIDLARQITSKLPPFVNCVGLFVDAKEDEIRAVLDQVALDTLQFHGQETEPSCTLYGKPYIKAIRMADSINLEEELSRYPSARAVLLDSFIQGQPGGTGQTFDWGRIPKTLTKPVILAGGLNDKNVRQAITEAMPYAVDVSGGVESSKGKKDPTKVINFIRETMHGAIK